MIAVRFVLHRDGRKTDAVCVFHAGDVICKLRGIALIVGDTGNKVSPVHDAAVFIGSRGAPRCAPDCRTSCLGLLGDAGFPTGAIGCDAGAQQRKPRAIVGGEQQVGIRSGQRPAHPGGRCAKAIYSLMHIIPIHNAVGGGGQPADKLDVIHPEGRSAAQPRTIIGSVNVNQHVIDAL
jgi:hypothetical protein